VLVSLLQAPAGSLAAAAAEAPALLLLLLLENHTAKSL
jgi:hypothetical protein